MTPEFQFDVFLSHSAKDKLVVPQLAGRLQRDGVFTGERFDVMRVRRWRERVLSPGIGRTG